MSDPWMGICSSFEITETLHWQDNSEEHREACIFPTGHNSITQCGGRLQKMPAFSSIAGCHDILIIRVARCCRLEMSPPPTLYLYRATRRGPLQVSSVPRRPRTRRHKTKRLFSRTITFNNFKLGFCKFHQVQYKKKKHILPTACIQCFVWISEQIAIISLYNINWLYINYQLDALIIIYS